MRQLLSEYRGYKLGYSPGPGFDLLSCVETTGKGERLRGRRAETGPPTTWVDEDMLRCLVVRGLPPPPSEDIRIAAESIIDGTENVCRTDIGPILSPTKAPVRTGHKACCGRESDGHSTFAARSAFSII